LDYVINYLIAYLMLTANISSVCVYVFKCMVLVIVPYI